MQKSVLALLGLLSALIVTCVYQKTYTLYSTSPKEITLVESATPAQNKSTVQTVAVEKKEEKTSPVISVPTSKKPVEVKPEPDTKPITVDAPVVTTTKSVGKETVKKEAKEKSAPEKTIQKPAQKVPAITTKKENTPNPAVTEKSNPESTLKAEPVTQSAAEKEIVDYIMWALKNREIALKNRDEVVARIQELVTKALNDRQVVLEERSKNEVALEKMQTELIDARDASYESVINPKTTNQGEK